MSKLSKWWTKNITKPINEGTKLLTGRNIAAVAAAPFTAGASLAMLQDNSGRSVIDGLRGTADVDKQNKFNANQAQLNREFQADMSNTAIQRSTADAMKAGYNPVLGATNPASTPSGATATSAGLPESPAGAISNMATSALNLTQGLKNLNENRFIEAEKKAGIANTVANTAETQAKTELIEQQTQFARKQFEILSEEDQIRQATLINRYEQATYHANAAAEQARIFNEWIHTDFGNYMYQQGINLSQIGQILNPMINAAEIGANSGRQGLTINNF